MKSPAQVQELAAWLAATDIGLLELRTPDGVLRLGRGPAGGIETLDAQDEGAPQAPAAFVAVAPGVGVFLHAHPLRGAPLACLGERVSAGQPVGLMQVGPLLLPVQAPRAGVPIAFLAPEGRAVGWGTPLVELQADE
ncbi:MAG TPA: acetyl-CoA carboxylase biotin carboxyl carrier protein subunit [Variovorax sp.]|jgi:acetyl-CoA carboxylase biotin carboxyl carrier protein|nr:acetyl-CoA carboxylase biotin carboxyl carrier protein subunit [Variovorax sp.]